MYTVTDLAFENRGDWYPSGPADHYTSIAEAHAAAKASGRYILDTVTGRWYDEDAHPMPTREEIYAVRREVQDGDTLLTPRESRHGAYLMPLIVSHARKTTTCWRYDLTDGYGHTEVDVRDMYLARWRIELASALAANPNLERFGSIKLEEINDQASKGSH